MNKPQTNCADIRELQWQVIDYLVDDFGQGVAGDGTWPTFKVLARLLQIPECILRGLVHDLKDRGILYLSPAVDLDGTPSGSGYFVSVPGFRAWEKAKE